MGGVSFNPDTFTKGGLIQDVDVEIIGGSCTLEPPEGYTQRDRIFVELDMKVLDTDEEVTQHWSAGKNTDFTPSADGDTMVPTGSRSALNDNSNWSLFCSNLANVQFPKEKLDGKISSLVGTQIHVVRIPAPEREGLSGAKKDGERKQTILVPNKLIKLPGEKSRARKGAAKATAAAPAAASAPAAAATETGDAASEALLAVAEIMAEGKVMPIPLLKAAVIRKHMKTDMGFRNEIVALAGDAAWLATQGFTVDAAGVQPAGA
jgi:hypothetical protein